jgi:sirohydrochlorin cobaltochelatase
MKKAILFAAHGSRRSASKNAIDNILKKAEREFPDVIIDTAYTSHYVRKKLCEIDGDCDLSIQQKLDAFMEQGVTHVVIQSLHVIPGVEFNTITRMLKKMEKDQNSPIKAVYGKPLLYDEQAMREVADMITGMPPERDERKEALILVAHGSKHSGEIYGQFQEILESRGHNTYMGKINTPQDIHDICLKIQNSGVKEAFLLPFLFGAGNHVQSDMAGENEESWKNIVSSYGIKVMPVVKGIGEFNIFADRWMSNLRRAFKELEEI